MTEIVCMPVAIPAVEPKESERATAILRAAQPLSTRIMHMLNTRSFNSTIDRMLTLNRVLDEALSGPSYGEQASRVWVPALDVVEKRDAYLVALEVPGIDPSSIDISFEQNVLTVRGTKPLGFDLDEKSEVRVYAAERVRGNLSGRSGCPSSWTARTSSPSIGMACSS
jgi:HSP20 family molecular chaperone IbpA